MALTRKMKPDEDFCQSAYDRFLRQSGHDHIAWHDGAEPPDYFVDVSGIQYAVEVTGIYGSRSVGNQEMPNQLIRMSLDKEFEKLKRRLLLAKQIHGYYVVRIKPVVELNTLLPQIESEVLKYLRDTCLDESSPSKKLPGNWTITKYARQPDVFEYSAGRAMWGSDADIELRRFVDDALNAKMRKLRNISVPIVILLHDAYHFASMCAWTNSVSGDAKARFHSILRVGNEGGCQLVWRQE